MKKYDYLIVGSGLFGATCANLLSKKGNKILVGMPTKVRIQNLY